ncbi:MAG: UDP-N-acetylmuramate--L-alanine ligase [bacterium]|nr:UDP-N-acetylmuramate--L-alanine ligase [bacterium]
MLKRIKLEEVRSVHCVGIGGVGVSAIARMLARMGKRVTGSDSGRSSITDALIREGIRVHVGHRMSDIGKPDLVVYTKAVSDTNPELVAARQKRIPCLSYAEMLGIISREKFTIAVAGAHGKTTTTAMVGKLLRDAKLDPTVIVGGMMSPVRSRPPRGSRSRVAGRVASNGMATNFIGGTGPYLVAEACEYKKSFLDIHPSVIVITNIDNDHLDYYKNIGNIKRAFREFVAKLGRNGAVICDPKAPHIREVIRGSKVVDYSKSPRLKDLNVIGDHNIRNAQAAYAVGKFLGIPDTIIRKSLRSFRGVGRRFEYKGTWNSVRFYDDYSHHPTEIRAALKAAREHFGSRRRIWVVFQPHLYSRTKLLMSEFATAFNDADHVLLADIYAARERDDGTVHARDLAVAMAVQTDASYVGSFKKIASELRRSLRPKDVVITMGAGEAYRVFDLLRARP